MLTPQEITKAFELLQLKTQEQRDTMLSKAVSAKPAHRVIVKLQASNITSAAPTTETSQL